MYDVFFFQIFLIGFDFDSFDSHLELVDEYYPAKTYEEIREIFADYMVWGTEHQYFNVVKVEKGYPVFPGSLVELKERVIKDFISKKAYEAKDYLDFWYTPYCMLGRGIVEDYPIGYRGSLILSNQYSITSHQETLINLFNECYNDKVLLVKRFFEKIKERFKDFTPFEQGRFIVECIDIGQGLLLFGVYGSQKKWQKPHPDQDRLTKRLWMHLELYGEIPNDLLEHWGYPYLQWLTEAPPAALILHPTVGLYQEA